MNRSSSTLDKLLFEISQVFEAANLNYTHGTETAWDEAAWLLASVLDISPQAEKLDIDTPISNDQEQRIREIASARISSRKPLAYLINSAWFCGLEFFVDERVIVPRSPIAELIANNFSPWLIDTPWRILDLCTGGGCIAIACAIQYSQASVTASDISQDALDVARVNIDRYKLGDRIDLVRSDIFEDLPAQQFDLIVCNPPYVDADDMAVLPEEHRHEPLLALAAGKDGLSFVDRMLRTAGNFLSPQGVLVCEVGNSEIALCKAYPTVPFTWIDFEHGGHGVFILDANELQKLL